MIKNLSVNLAVFETGNKFGNMNTSAKFYPETYTAEERAQAFLNHRLAAAKEFGFDGHKFFMADQKDQNGSYFELTPDYVAANPNGWTDINQDILIITDKIPGVVAGHPVADCPVVMMTDEKNKVTAVCHCSAALVDKKMPMMVADALGKSYNSKDEDIKTYVSACAGPNWTYNVWPNWAIDQEVWQNAITKGEDGLYKIDIRKAIAKQLQERNITKVDYNLTDTITDSNFFSNCAARQNPAKSGRHFAGAFYQR
jgi:hypothetical protein